MKLNLIIKKSILYDHLKLCYSIKTSQLSYIISWFLYIVQKIQLLLLLFLRFKL